MDAKQTLYDFTMQRFEIFKSQDPKIGDFDVTFEINGKKLFANKFILRSVSSTFDSMLSDRWSKRDERVKIKGYSFDDFKEFLIFLYSGECTLTKDNIAVMIDIAEFFGVKIFKKYCENFLISIIDQENFPKMFELADKYSMEEFKQFAYVQRLDNILKPEIFSNFTKSVIRDIIEINQNNSDQEKLFVAVYMWGVFPAFQLQKEDKNLNLNEAIKKEIVDFLPFFNFKLMDKYFRNDFVFRIINKNGKIMKGQLQCPDDEIIADIIKLQKNSYGSCYSDGYCYWNSKKSNLTKPCILKKDDNIKWYLFFDFKQDIAIIPRKCVSDETYLLAEMFAENGFILDSYCKIEVV
uniref:BTB domain-containing protein n=1 Tax=Panagrolaimus davidi TaxID=227884 RepID=A0A914QF58_9BILA